MRDKRRSESAQMLDGPGEAMICDIQRCSSIIEPPIEIKPGQHFRDSHPTAFGQLAHDLIVGRVFVGTDGKEYAQVRSASHLRDTRTLSVAVLQEKRRFVEVVPK